MTILYEDNLDNFAYFIIKPVVGAYYNHLTEFCFHYMAGTIPLLPKAEMPGL